MKTWSLSKKIVVSLVVVMLVMTIVLSVVVVVGVTSSQNSVQRPLVELIEKRQQQIAKNDKDLIDNEADSKVDLLVALGGYFVANYNYEALTNIATVLEQSPEVAKVLFIDIQGKVMVDTKKAYDEKSSDIRIIEKEFVVEGTKIGALKFVLDYGPSMVKLGEDIKRSKEKLGEIEDSVNSKKSFFVVASTGGMVLAFILFSVLAMLFFRTTVIKFLIELSRTLERVASKVDQKSMETKAAGKKLAASSSEQISSLHICISAIEEMQSLVAQTEGSTKNSLNVIKGVTGLTDDGTKAMGRLGNAMEHFEAFGTKLQEVVDVINDISTRTKVINDIVFKTQLLSFNASIEAARAGQHGRGFSVVAEEVGKLAKISGSAAADIRQLLEKSKARVQALVEITTSNIKEGKDVYNDAREIFTQISSSVVSVNSNIGGIVTATSEQGQGIRQVSETISTVDDLANENSKGANESQKIAEELLFAVDDLKKLFKDVNSYVFGGNRETFVKDVVGDENSMNELSDFDNDYDYQSEREDEDENSVEADSERATVSLGTSTDYKSFDELGIPSADEFHGDHSCQERKKDVHSSKPGDGESKKLDKIINDLVKKTHSSIHIEQEPAVVEELKKIDPDDF